MDKEIFIYAHYNTYSKETEYQIGTWERSDSSGDVFLEKRIISFDTPNDKELRVRLSQSLKLKLADAKAEHYKAELEIQEQINELLAIEDKSNE